MVAIKTAGGRAVRAGVRMGITWLLIPLSGWTAGCDRGSDGDALSRSGRGGGAASTQPLHAPEYRFAGDVRDRQPEIARFLRGFLETCLTGDYEGYRKYVSRRQQPESRDRFQRIYDAIDLLTVTRIEEVEVPTLPPPVYLVVSEVEFIAGRSRVFGEDRRAIAIVVFKEEGEWRMLPAPSRLQPQRRGRNGDSQPASEPASAPADFPWEQLDEG